MAKNGPKRHREPVVIILSDDEGPRPPKRQWTPILISSDDEGPSSPQNVRATKPKLNGLWEEEKNGGKRTEDLTAKHGELMRSWVDIGIQLAIREMKGEDVSAELGQNEVNPEPFLAATYAARSPKLNPQPKPLSLPPLKAYISQLEPHPNNPPPQHVRGLKYPAKGQFGPASYDSVYTVHPPISHCGSRALPLPLPYNHIGQNGLVPTANFNYSNPSTFSEGPHAQYLAYHSGKIPGQSTVRQPLLPTFKNSQIPSAPPRLAKQYNIHDSTKIFSQPLSQISDNIQHFRSTTQEKHKTFHTSFILPANQYLSFYELERCYCVAKLCDTGNSSMPMSAVRIRWLSELGINIAPYSTVWTAEYKRLEVEDKWAELSAEKRRRIEMHAVCYKYDTVYNVTLLPLRSVPAERLPLDFSALEKKYFMVPERKLTDYNDFVPKWKGWLSSLGLFDPVYYVLARNAGEEKVISDLYSKKSAAERRRIETKAAYLNVLLQPSSPLWADIENTYAIYTRDSGVLSWQERRREWLQSLGIDYEPFCYLAGTTDLGQVIGEKHEIAWYHLGAMRREEIIKKAITIKASPIPLVSWVHVEDLIGLSKEAECQSDVLEYVRRRKDWLRKIGMSDVCLSKEELQKIWIGKSFKEREDIFNKARHERIKIEWERKDDV